MSPQPSPGITQLLQAWCRGDQAALDRLIPLVYDELHRLAHRDMARERSGHVLQTTALVHEAYVRLIDASQIEWQHRAHFFAISAKVIREDRLGSPGTVRRFQREALAAAGFRHPNVVTVHDYGIEAGRRAFLVMELLEGATLREALRASQRLDAARVVKILRGLCSAVEAAHAGQLIHRDLKPENIFLARGGIGASETVKVLDFGIAKFLPGVEPDADPPNLGETDAGLLVGTPGYLSPEQRLGEAPAVS